MSHVEQRQTPHHLHTHFPPVTLSALRSVMGPMLALGASTAKPLIGSPDRAKLVIVVWAARTMSGAALMSNMLVSRVDETLNALVQTGQMDSPQFNSLLRARDGLRSEPPGTANYQRYETLANTQIAQVEQNHTDRLRQSPEMDPTFAAACADCVAGQPCCLLAFASARRRRRDPQGDLAQLWHRPQVPLHDCERALSRPPVRQSQSRADRTASLP